jgi:hypothetical protein
MLMTGRYYDVHVGQTGGGGAGNTNGVPLAFTLLPQALQTAGYTSETPALLFPVAQSHWHMRFAAGRDMSSCAVLDALFVTRVAARAVSRCDVCMLGLNFAVHHTHTKKNDLAYVAVVLSPRHVIRFAAMRDVAFTSPIHTLLHSHGVPTYSPLILCCSFPPRPSVNAQ